MFTKPGNHYVIKCLVKNDPIRDMSIYTKHFETVRLTVTLSEKEIQAQQLAYNIKNIELSL